MPVQWFAGFEAGDTNELVALVGAVSVGTFYKRSGNYGGRIIAPSNTGTAYITLANGYDANGNPATISRTAYTLGFALRLAALPPTVGAWEYLLYLALGTTHRASLRLAQPAGPEPTGALRLHLGASGGPPVAEVGGLALGRWYYAELAVLSDRYVWRMDGQVVAQGLGGPGGLMNSAYLGKRFNLASQGYTLDVDDLYTGDDGVFYGPTTRVARLNAGADGTAASWLIYPPNVPDP